MPALHALQKILRAHARPTPPESVSPGEFLEIEPDVFAFGISYRGNALAYADVLRGEVPVIFPTPASVAPHLKSGKLRALAVTTKERSRLFPGLPAVAETVPDYEAATLIGAFVPAGTPTALIARLNQEIAGVLKLPEVRDRFTNIGTEPAPSSPEEFGALVKSEMARLGKVIKEAGIRDH